MLKPKSRHVHIIADVRRITLPFSKCSSVYGFSTVIEGMPSVDQYEDVLYVPAGLGFEPGLYDRARRLITSSGYFRGLPSRHGMIDLVHGSFTSPIDPDTISDRLSDTVIFGGLLVHHFGHFIVGTLSRFWSTQFPEHKILIINPEASAPAFQKPYINQIFSTIGIDSTTFITLDKPTMLDRVVVPSPSFEENNIAYRVFSTFCHSIGAKLAGDPAHDLETNEMIYLSKSRLQGGVSNVLNEADIEKELVKQGFRIVYPELIPLRDQIRLFRGNSIIAGCAGSAFHTSIFSPSSCLVILSPHDHITSNQKMIDNINRNSAHYLYRNDEFAVEPSQNGFQVSYALRNPKQTAIGLREYAETLIRSAAGSIPSTSARTRSLISAEIKNEFLTDIDAFTDAIVGWVLQQDSRRISEAILSRYSCQVEVSFRASAAFHQMSSEFFTRYDVMHFIFHKYEARSPMLDTLIQRWIQTILLWRYCINLTMNKTIIINFNDEGVDPGVCFCTNRNDMILVPDPVFLGTEGYFWHKENCKAKAIEWNERESKALWRGSTTGQQTGNIWELPRVKLVKIGRQNPDLFDVGITSLAQLNLEDAASIDQAGLMANYLNSESFGKNKFLINIDGNTSAWSALMEQLNSGSLVLKIASTHQYRQWYYDRLIPWVNFVPIKSDLSDLVSTVDSLRQNDSLARQIAAEGQKLAFSMTMDAELDRSLQAIKTYLNHNGQLRI